MTLTLAHYLILGAILFAIGIFGIFLNRRNPVSYTHLDVYKRQVQAYQPVRLRFVRQELRVPGWCQVDRCRPGHSSPLLIESRAQVLPRFTQCMSGPRFAHISHPQGWLFLLAMCLFFRGKVARALFGILRPGSGRGRLCA